jgi:hypothetical protein
MSSRLSYKILLIVLLCDIFSGSNAFCKDCLAYINDIDSCVVQER